MGAAVRSNSYFIGKVVDSNYFTSRILLISDLNSKIPVIIEPGAVSAILSGTGDNKLGKIEYLPENNNIKDGNVVYTSGADGIISSGMPVGKIVIDNDQDDDGICDAEEVVGCQDENACNYDPNATDNCGQSATWDTNEIIQFENNMILGNFGEDTEINLDINNLYDDYLDDEEDFLEI